MCFLRDRIGNCLERRPEFFQVILDHGQLGEYYTINFKLMQHHGYSLAEIENLLPFEREIYIAMLARHIEEERKHAKQR